MRHHAVYEVLPAEREVPELPFGSVLIRDVSPASHPSVTNDAEHVVCQLARHGLLKDRNRLFYFDSYGAIDEIVHREGRFKEFAPGPFREGSPMCKARNTLAGMSTRSVVRLKEQGTVRVLDGKPGMTFPVDRAHLNVRHDSVIVHVRDYRYLAGRAAGYQIWTMHVGDDCELIDWETAKGVRI